MKRALVACLLLPACAPPSEDADFEVAEASIVELQDAMLEGRVTSAQLVDLYLARVRAYDRAGPALNTIVRLNPRARAQADSLDAERAAGTVRGPLHGIPVLMKDNYDISWMPTTGSSLALAGLQPPDDAHQVARLREAGVVFLGKTNLHELAAGITTISSLGGQTRNPYDPSRNPGGSSGGTGTGAAVAASFAVVGWGTDTCGSIRIPSAVHNLFGLRPTKGLSSIDGILPLSHSQDTGGPLARTVTDLAIALDATVGMDPADPATAILEGRDVPAFRDALDAGALEGARIGALDLEEGSAGSVVRVIRGALEEMEGLGATVVDVSLPDGVLSNTGLIDFDFKFDLADYLAGIPEAPVTSLGEIIEMGLHHEALDRTFRRRNAREERDTPELAETLERRRALTAAVTDLMDREDLDALAYPTMRQETALIGAAPVGATCSLSAHSGLPALSIPAGFTESGLPVGLELLGRVLDDARLVGMAFAFESAAPKRRAPLRTPPLVDGAAPPPVRIAVGEAVASAGEAAMPATSAALDSAAGAAASEAAGAATSTVATASVEMEVDLPRGLLTYRIAFLGAELADVYGAVLRRVAEEGEGVVVLRLGGPGEVEMAGAVELSPRLLEDLMEGRLELVLAERDGVRHGELAPENQH